MNDSPKKRPNPLASYGQRRKDRIDDLAVLSAPAPALDEVAVDESGAIAEKPGVSLWQSAWRRLRRNPVFLLGLAITIAFILIAAFAPWIARKDPVQGYLIDKVRPQSNSSPARSRASCRSGPPGPRPALPLIVGSRQTLIVGVLATSAASSAVLSSHSPVPSAAGSTPVMRAVDVMLDPSSCSPCRSAPSQPGRASGP